MIVLLIIDNNLIVDCKKASLFDKYLDTDHII